MRVRSFVLIVLFALLINPGTVLADPPIYAQQDGTPSPDSQDPQARVGRVSLLDGTVSFHTPDQDSWSYATLNFPVMSGNALWTEPGAHAEVQVGSAALRLDSSTEVYINELDDQALRAELTQGTVNLHVGNLEDGVSYELMTPHETITINQPGTYRVTASGDAAPSQVAVLRGQATIRDSVSSVTIGAGETAVVPPGNLASIAVEETLPTAFDNWSLARDNYEEPRPIDQYVSPEMTGYQDLDAYGAWQTVPTYGPVWIPAGVAPDWAPYHYGHWAWVRPWGWTWIDDAPWGFTPFHYGRWAHLDRGWCWIPGTRTPHPVYAPALVAFLGGNNWGLSIGIGSRPIGWFPLGPGEAFRPGYPVSSHYIQAVNITSINHSVNIKNTYANNPVFANRRFATVVPANDFAASRPVAQVALHVSAQNLAAAPLSQNARPPTINHQPLVPRSAEAGAPPEENRARADQREGQAPSVPHSPTAPVQPKIQPAAQPAVQPTVHAPAPPTTRFDHVQPQTTGRSSLSQSEHVTNPEHSAENHGTAAPPHNTQPVEHPALHEVTVQRPQQKAPLVPSHQGWVRKPPEEPKPHPEEHHEPAHDEHTPQQPGGR